MKGKATMSDKMATTETRETPAGPGGGRYAATREEGRYLAPPVDIYETEDSLVVLADLPGVGRDGVHVSVDEDILTIRGRTEAPRQAALESVYREFALLDFYRQFRLTDLVDQAKISGELRHGVLTIRLPKAEKRLPKRIEVQLEP